MAERFSADFVTEIDRLSSSFLLMFVFLLISTQDIMISLNLYRGIRNLLDSCHVPELVKVLSPTFSLLFLNIPTVTLDILLYCFQVN